MFMKLVSRELAEIAIIDASERIWVPMHFGDCNFSPVGVEVVPTQPPLIRLLQRLTIRWRMVMR
ncbi:hypothetical protein PAECIP111891_04207 [Paenibacillus allorhizoplanae]|uniref:Uncharacterized protein n=1 Tax=Paenibacillus allorhizoplanae TaxID=2905648 RepID=A0ABN8GUK8_9BACL|nr:hypothetical protein PAECIP111891_04207 [Paenibacillus allorhizoplanae]